MVKVKFVTIVESPAALKFRPKKQRIRNGGIDQFKILYVIVVGLHVIDSHEGVEQGVFIVYLYVDIFHGVAIRLDFGGFKGKLKIPFVRIDPSPDKGIGPEFYLRKQYPDYLVINFEPKSEPLSIRYFKRLVIGIDTSYGILYQPAQFLDFKITSYPARNNIGRVYFYYPGGVVGKG